MRARLLLAAVIGVVATHAVCLGHGFVDFDDDVIFLNNPLLRRTDLGAAWDILSFERPDWRPLRDLSHWLDFLVHGQDPFWAHLHNLALLAGVVAAAGTFFGALGFGGALGAFALFVAFAHPVQVEAVAWVSGRKELLAGLFFFLMLRAFLAFVDGRRRALTGAVVVVCFALGVMAKGHVVVAPAVLALVWGARRLQGPVGWRAPAALTAAVGALAVAAVPLIARGGVMLAPQLQGTLKFSLVTGDRLQLPLRYLGHLLWPVDLNHIYLTGRLGPAHTALAVASVIVTIALLGLAASWLRRRDARGPLLLVPMALMLPYLHLRPGVVYMADRYLFLAVPFVAMLAVFLAADGLRRAAVAPRLQRGLAGVLGAALVTLTLQQQAAWRDPVTLWSRMTQVYPESDWGFDRLGQALFRAGDLEGAAGAFLAAAERAPRKSKHPSNAAAALMGLGRTEMARVLLHRALSLNPDDVSARRNLARLPPNPRPPSGTGPE